MKLQLFYHVAVMGNWQEVVAEQLGLFKRVGLPPLIGIVGPKRGELYRMIGGYGKHLFRHPDLTQYETPTHQKLWEWCRENPSDAVMYCHTKGVSEPQDKNRWAWRKLMEYWVVERWMENLAILADHDVVGFNYRHKTHFSGNFWLARSDWISKLVSPAKARKGGRRKRYVPERWLLSKAGYRYISLGCKNVGVARAPRAIQQLRALRAKRGLE